MTQKEIIYYILFPALVLVSAFSYYMATPARKSRRLEKKIKKLMEQN